MKFNAYNIFICISVHNTTGVVCVSESLFWSSSLTSGPHIRLVTVNTSDKVLRERKKREKSGLNPNIHCILNILES